MPHKVPSGLSLVAPRDTADTILHREVDNTSGDLAEFHAVDNGISLVRVADNGISFATDPYGRSIAWVEFFSTSERVVVAQVPAYHVTTISSIIGDLFGWLSVIGFLGTSIWAIANWRRATPKDTSLSE